MITSATWAGKCFAVLGLARSGAASVRALLAGGAEVIAWDSDAAKREALRENFNLPPPLVMKPSLGATNEQPWWPPSGAGAKLKISEFQNRNLAGFDALVVSPGVPLNRHPIATKAREAGVPIIGDIELFAQARPGLPPHRVVGITGTNGKSTTTTLIHHICRTAGVPTAMGGNIGLPILAQEPLPTGGVYVLELSSYQIDLTQSLDCDVAVLLNITPDHLDRYDGFDSYAASKARLFALQSAGHAAVIGTGDAASAGIADEVAQARGGDVTRIARDAALDQSLWPALQGPHNAQNAAAAIAACEALGIPAEAIAAGLASFGGLPHRMERVATRGGVAFVNDSKATNADSTAPALAAFPRIHWILGGQAKTDDLDACRPGFPNVVRAYTIGASGEMFARLLEGEMAVTRSGTLAQAVRDAAAHAAAGDTVLLSPASASFDQFRDYEDRGAQFRAAVEALA